MQSLIRKDSSLIRNTMSTRNTRFNIWSFLSSIYAIFQVDKYCFLCFTQSTEALIRLCSKATDVGQSEEDHRLAKCYRKYDYVKNTFLSPRASAQIHACIFHFNKIKLLLNVRTEYYMHTYLWISFYGSMYHCILKN